MGKKNQARGAQECVIDTMVLQKANAPLTHVPGERTQFRKRLRLLERVRDRALVILFSEKLLAEYARQIRSPRNDLIRAFFELLTQPGHAVANWPKRWSPAQREARHKCRFPHEDVHVLRTALRPQQTTIFTEERRMLDATACVLREFQVRISALPES